MLSLSARPTVSENTAFSLVTRALRIMYTNSQRECFLLSFSRYVLPHQIMHVVQMVFVCCCQCLSRQSTMRETSLYGIYVLTANMLLCLFRVQSPTMMLWQRDLSARKATWVHPALVSRIGAYLCLLISGILEQIRSCRCRDNPFGICSALCSCMFCLGIPPVE